VHSKLVASCRQHVGAHLLTCGLELKGLGRVEIRSAAGMSKAEQQERPCVIAD